MGKFSTEFLWFNKCLYVEAGTSILVLAMQTRTITSTESGAINATRTLSTDKGKSVTTSLSDAEALAILDAMPAQPGSFLHTLQTASKLSFNMMVWVHIYAQPKPAQTGEAVGDLSTFTRIFEKAATHLKKPRLTIMDDEGHSLCIYVAPSTSVNAGCIYVKSGDRTHYYGKINTAGKFVSSDAPASIAAYLRKFAQNPEAEAARYGKLTGRCCFCAKQLTDSRSTEVGYGPQCAEKWNLSWGSRKF